MRAVQLIPFNRFSDVGWANVKSHPDDAFDHELDDVEAVEPYLHDAELAEPELHAVEPDESELHDAELAEPELHDVELAELELHDAEPAEPELHDAEADDAPDVLEALHTGRARIERRLRQPIHVKTYPGRAGEILRQPAAEAEGYGYQGYLNDENVYAPFAHRLDWEIARWCQLRGPGSTAVSELLSIDGVSILNCFISIANSRQVQAALGLSFKNSRELRKIIDRKLPNARPRFHRATVKMQDETLDVFYRDIIQCIRTLYGHAEFAKYLVFASEKHYTDESCTTRLYHDMHTGK